MVWAAAGFAAALAIMVPGCRIRTVQRPCWLPVVVSRQPWVGFVCRDYWLGVQIRRRAVRMLAEFPSLAELMALAVSAGESATGALDRICRSATG